ncbi:response regulator [Sporosarcina sp. FSL W7-1349]|uniref:response regulator transcription factor n=1 Tax=Sporosarcina sp. FSL W7-1349 TaxID=2921561 RepID=UPI0030FB6F5F
MIKMMIVEDEPWIRKGIEHMLPWVKLGIAHMGSASNGAEGLELLETHQPDIILTDIKMPIMDGLQFIERLQGMDRNTPKVIILTGYNDFAYAKDAIKYGVVDYILKPIDPEELIETVTKLVTVIQQERAAVLDNCRMQMAQFLYEQLLNPSDTVEPDFDLPYPYFRFLLTTQPIPTERFDADETIRDCFSFQIGQSIVYTLCYADDKASDMMLNTILSDFQPIGWSDLHNIREMKVAYQEAQLSLQQNLRNGPNAKMRSLKKYYFVSDQEKELLATLQQGDQNAAHQLVQGLLEHCISLEEKLILQFQLYAFLERYLDKAQTSLEDYRFLQKFKLAHSQEDVQDITVHILYPIIEQIVNEWDQSPSKIGQLAKEYIDGHYKNPSLSLSLVAEQLNVSPSYLSHIFKEELKVNFSSYVTEKRVYTAQEELAHTHLPIYIISEKVGFNDSKYFNRVFKKQTGLTPKRFRESQSERIIPKR